MTDERSSLAVLLGKLIHFFEQSFGELFDVVISFIDFFLYLLVMGKYLFFFIIFESLNFGLQTIVIVL